MPLASRFKSRPFYGWTIIVALFFTGLTLYGIINSFGVFFKPIGGEFNITRAATSAIISTNMLLIGVVAIIGGWATDKYGPRVVTFLMGLFTGLSLVLTSQTTSLWQMFITYSLLLAVGTGALYPAAMATAARWFDKRRGLALGIVNGGIGLGTVTMPLFANYLIYRLDWRPAYLVMGITAWLVVIPLSRLLRRAPSQIVASAGGASSLSVDATNENHGTPVVDSSPFKIFRAKSFWLIISAWLLHASSILLVYTHLVPHATDLGISSGEAAGLLSFMGGVSIAGRVLTGVLSDKIGGKLASIICALLGVAAFLWLIASQELWMLYLFALVYGFSYGGLNTGVGVLVSGTFHLTNIGVLFGVLDFGFGIGAAIGPYIGGLIFDVTNSYFLAFLISALAMLAASAFIAFVRRESP
ncbi:MAG: MFS transporter [Chloroflexi bacterium]|nr:MFS transporter [Chloroflexota bacterium]